MAVKQSLKTGNNNESRTISLALLRRPYLYSGPRVVTCTLCRARGDGGERLPLPFRHPTLEAGPIESQVFQHCV